MIYETLFAKLTRLVGTLPEPEEVVRLKAPGAGPPAVRWAPRRRPAGILPPSATRSMKPGHGGARLPRPEPPRKEP
jgi:hypothetical protein